MADHGLTESPVEKAQKALDQYDEACRRAHEPVNVHALADALRVLIRLTDLQKESA